MSKEVKKDEVVKAGETVAEDYSKWSLMQKLYRIQKELKAPKNQHNKFGNYNYRSAEDILEAVKPLCYKYGVIVSISDDIVFVPCQTVRTNKNSDGESSVESQGRIYVKAIVTVHNCDNSTQIYTTTAFAREEESKKGMDGSQVTGAASSYARKYALNGMFAIDDTKDSDATNDHGKGSGSQTSASQSVKSALEAKPKPKPTKKAETWTLFKSTFKNGEDNSVIAEQFKKFCTETTNKSLESITEDDWDKLLHTIQTVVYGDNQ